MKLADSNKNISLRIIDSRLRCLGNMDFANTRMLASYIMHGKCALDMRDVIWAQLRYLYECVCGIKRTSCISLSPIQT